MFPDELLDTGIIAAINMVTNSIDHNCHTSPLPEVERCSETQRTPRPLCSTSVLDRLIRHRLRLSTSNPSSKILRHPLIVL